MWGYARNKKFIWKLNTKIVEGGLKRLHNHRAIYAEVQIKGYFSLDIFFLIVITTVVNI